MRRRIQWTALHIGVRFARGGAWPAAERMDEGPCSPVPPIAQGDAMDMPLWYWHLGFGLLVIVIILLYESD